MCFFWKASTSYFEKICILFKNFQKIISMFFEKCWKKIRMLFWYKHNQHFLKIKSSCCFSFFFILISWKKHHHGFLKKFEKIRKRALFIEKCWVQNPHVFCCNQDWKNVEEVCWYKDCKLGLVNWDQLLPLKQNLWSGGCWSCPTVNFC